MSEAIAPKINPGEIMGWPFMSRLMKTADSWSMPYPSA